MRTEFLFRVVLCAALSTGCSEAELPESASVPTAESSIALTASGADTVAETGRPVQLKLAIEERFARRDSCRLRVRVATGYATVFLDDTPLTAETESTIPYAIMNKASSSCVVSLNVVPEAAPVVEQTVQLVCEAASYDKAARAVDTVEIRTMNPAPIEVRTEYVHTPLLVSESLPIDFAIAKADYTGSYTVAFTHAAGQGYCLGDYTVVPVVAQGAGKFLYDGQPVGPSGIVVPAGTTTIDYRPAMLGEHLLDFEVRAGDAVKQARTYCEVVKIFTIACEVTHGIRISGAGEYRVEGEPVVFAMANEPNYNFEVVGWYDADGKLLSTESSCTIAADYTAPTDYRLELEKREVKFTMGEPYRKPYRYPVPGSSGQIASWKTVYDYRLNLQYDYRPTDNILLYYEKYRWQTTVPPVEQKEWTVESATGYFWRIDNRFRLLIRQSDNPDLVFDRARHAVESASTRYLLPAEIEMQ